MLVARDRRKCYFDLLGSNRTLGHGQDACKTHAASRDTNTSSVKDMHRYEGFGNLQRLSADFDTMGGLNA